MIFLRTSIKKFKSKLTPGNYFVTIERDFSNAIFQKRKQNFFASSFWKLCCGQILSGLQMDSFFVVRPTNFINKQHTL